MIESTIGRVSAGEDLSMEEMANAMELIMDGACSESEIALLLTALRAKGEAVTEIAGAAAAMRRKMTPIHSRHQRLVDTCGTGGDGSRTFNISTAAAIVAAATGAKVAKHGNRAITSNSGSADVLAHLGVNVEASVAQVERCLEQVGICFCFAPLFHHSMRHVAKVRRQLGVPTIFNMLGPLCNPAGASYQLLGVGRPSLRPLLSEALALLQIRRAIVVSGADGLDEVTLCGETHVTEIREAHVSQFSWSPSDFGLNVSDRESLLVDGPEASAKVIREVLDGQHGPPRDIVLANAAAALWLTEDDGIPAECARRAAQAIDTGAARDLLVRLAEVSSE